MFHRSWGLMMIQRNISAPSTLLDFSNPRSLSKELTSTAYDVVGISGIIPNFGKVREMCRQVRKLSPLSSIIVNGHVAAIPGIDKLIDADYSVLRREIGWMRRYLGDDCEAPIRHPEIMSGFGMRVLGIGTPDSTRDGGHHHPVRRLSHGMRFCTTSAFFGGKGKSFHFFESGDEIFEVMEHMEHAMNVRSSS